MLRIAVCEDNIRELREIMSLIEEYPRKSAYGIEATAFSDSEELAKRIDEFDVFSSRLPDAGNRRARAFKTYQREIYDNKNHYIHLAV